MATNRIIFEYPRGLEIAVTFVGPNGTRIHTFAMASPLLLRLGPGLEFESASSGNVMTLLGRSESDSSDTDTDKNEDDEDQDETGSDMDLDISPEDLETTIDLVSSEEDNITDDDDDDEEEDDDDNTDLIYISHPTNA